jgi:hypothetical protein
VFSGNLKGAGLSLIGYLAIDKGGLAALAMFGEWLPFFDFK